MIRHISGLQFYAGLRSAQLLGWGRRQHPRNQAARVGGPAATRMTAFRNSIRRAPIEEHARNQIETSSAEITVGGGQDLGWRAQRGGPEAARAAIDAARHPTQDRPALSSASHHPCDAG